MKRKALHGRVDHVNDRMTVDGSHGHARSFSAMNESMHVRMSATLERIDIVATFQDANDWYFTRAECHHLGGDPRKIVLCQLEGCERVVGVCIEARTQKDSLRLKISDGRQQ